MMLFLSISGARPLRQRLSIAQRSLARVPTKESNTYHTKAERSSTMTLPPNDHRDDDTSEMPVNTAGLPGVSGHGANNLSAR